jgi:hypothetical protein
MTIETCAFCHSHAEPLVPVRVVRSRAGNEEPRPALRCVDTDACVARCIELEMLRALTKGGETAQDLLYQG